MQEAVIKTINDATNIVVIQAENPDGDSLGSALALEAILIDQGKKVSLFCPVDIPKYLRYIKGWDRIVADFDYKADMAIIVDTVAEVLLTKVIDTPGVRHFLESHPVVVIDHHDTDSSLGFKHEALLATASATAEIIYNLADQASWKIDQTAAESLLIAILSDSLGLSTESVSPQTFHIAGQLTELGAKSSEIEQRRREYMKKSAEILEYKAKLIERIEYLLDGKLALVRIPWEEIQAYSDQYNPSVLVLDEMRLVDTVQIAVAIKTYPDGRLTGKLRSNIPISSTVAGYFGGGGHDYAAGFRVYESIDKIIPELVNATDKALKDYSHDN